MSIDAQISTKCAPAERYVHPINQRIKNWLKRSVIYIVCDSDSFAARLPLPIYRG